ncbi:MAG TPA: heparan-alpha-glucosaminide N-acetyltransferase domain-containing protein, partial [Polyangiaceae bacterium]|nr:heparan-alpha-glucosaminide N-acetyltransferase domain-containing protein [Polyangiaceae bacterium]
PVFVLLAGMSAHLYGKRVASRAALSRYLSTRGLWLVALELTIVRFGWSFHHAPDLLFFQVIWAIGVSMLVLAALVFMPRAAILGVGLGLVIGHHLLDGVAAADLGTAGWLWHFVHEPALLHPSAELTVLALYPLVPWVGVLALGYGLGPVLALDPEGRQLWLHGVGLAVCCGFVLLRASNLYGDPTPWRVEPELWATLLSFINCEKYPPSLLYLSMTLGPALLALAHLDAGATLVATGGGLLGRAKRAVVTIGRVPLFFYVSHIYLVHLAAVIAAALTTGETGWLFGGLPPMSKPPGYGFSLATVYVFWAAFIALLYVPSRWFAALKARRRDWWLSYL